MCSVSSGVSSVSSGVCSVCSVSSMSSVSSGVSSGVSSVSSGVSSSEGLLGSNSTFYNKKSVSSFLIGSRPLSIRVQTHGS